MRKIIPIFLIILYLSCAAQKPVTKEKETEPEETENVTVLFEPLSLLENDVQIEPPKWEIKKIDYESLLPPQLRTDTTQISLNEMVQGFRVQVGVYMNLNYAIEISDKASGLLDESVYLDFDPPFYKVRVGDYFLRKDAMELLEKVIIKDFEDSFIIPTTVYKYPELKKQEEKEKRKAESDSVDVNIMQNTEQP